MKRLCVLFLSVSAGCLIAGCGGGSSASSSSSSASTSTVAAVTGVPSSPAASTHTTAGAAVAHVAGAPIAKSAYEHWLTVEDKLGGAANAGHRALAFLLTSQWMLDEAAGRHLAVSDAEVKRRYNELVHQSFPKAGALQKYLATSGQSEADLLARVKVELLRARVAAQIDAGKSGTQRGALLASFQERFHAHWKTLTSCMSGYVMEDCSQYHGGPEDLAPSQPAHASSGGHGTAGK